MWKEGGREREKEEKREKRRHPSQAVSSSCSHEVRSLKEIFFWFLNYNRQMIKAVMSDRACFVFTSLVPQIEPATELVLSKLMSKGMGE